MKIINFILFTFHSSIAVKNYTGYTLLRSVPFTRNHVEFLRNLSEVLEIDYWRYPGAVERPVDILVAPDEKARLMRTFDDKNHYYTTIIEDVQRAFDEQTIKPYIRRKMASFDFKNYFKLSDIYKWMHDLAQAYPKEVTVINLGKTYENRDILSLHILFKKSKSSSTVVVEGGIHAREWISPAFVCYMMDQIINSIQSEDNQLRSIALTYQWYFVPVINPDGYAYSFEKDRLWRKNRSNGHGVDLNRNFDVEFGSIGVSKRENSEVYCGSKAFSELESVAMRNLVTTVHRNLKYYLAFHSYGNLIIIPYAHSKEHLENFDEVNKVAEKLQAQIIRRYGTRYIHGTAYDNVGYRSSGVSGCWVKRKFQVPYVLTFELRDNGTYGFALPPNLILPTCKETMDGIKVLLNPKKEHMQGNRANFLCRQLHCFINLELLLFSALLVAKTFKSVIDY